MLSQLDQMGDSTDLYENNCNCVCHCIIKCGTSTRADLQRTSSDYYKASPHFLHCEVLNYEVLRRSYPVLGYYIPVHRGGLEHKFRPEIILHPRRSKPLHWVSHKKRTKTNKNISFKRHICITHSCLIPVCKLPLLWSNVYDSRGGFYKSGWWGTARVW